jgi:hypothetical protein
MSLLLANRPCSSFSRQRNPVSVHKAPGTIDKLPDDIGWARVKRRKSRLLRVLKSLLLDLAITVLDPSPILKREF